MFFCKKLKLNVVEQDDSALCVDVYTAAHMFAYI